MILDRMISIDETVDEWKKSKRARNSELMYEDASFYSYIWLCVLIFLYSYMWLCVFIFLYSCMWLCVLIFLYSYMCLCVLIFLYSYMWLCEFIFLYSYMHMHICEYLNKINLIIYWTVIAIRPIIFNLIFY